MPAIMRILGWKAFNLRCPDHEVNLCDSEGRTHTISLLQMPNGTGKTTTLSLLRAALSGSADKNRWDRDKVREFARRGSLANGRFEVFLMLNGKRATMIMNFDFEAGIVGYQTTYGEGQTNRFNPPGEFRRFLNENFVSFYVFDGELAENLLSRDHTDAEEVVKQLFQVNTLRTLALKVDEYWEQRTQRLGAREPRGLSRHQNRLAEFKARLSSLEIQKRALESRRSTLEVQRNQQSAAYEESIAKEDGVSRRRSDARVEVERRNSEVRECSRQVLDLMTQPQALSPVFAEAIYDLKINLDRVKLPDSAAREFFAELAEEEECICGRAIDEAIRGIIRERSDRYLGSDDVSLLNSMKTSIDEAVGKSRTEPNQSLGERVLELTGSVSLQREAKTELSEVELEAANSDPAVQQAKENLEKFERQIEETTRELQQFDSADDSENTCDLNIIKRRIEEAETRVAEVTQTLDLREKRDILRRILDKAYNQAKRGITAEICQQANDRIEKLMPYNNIRIDRIERCLHLQGQSNGSAGEQLSVAYGFLSTLFDRSEHKLPFVVDSPAGAIDLDIRSEIGALVPKLSGQFIAFTISSEREGFVSSLNEASKEPIQYLTLFRKGSEALADKARNIIGHLETDNGFCVESEAFFNTFQDKEVGS